MKARAYQMLVSGLVALLVASVAAPGLTLHNCRHFGTRSTQLCGCCEVELEASRGCCSQKSEPTAAVCHADGDTRHTETRLESSCCFTSYEGPFSFEAAGAAQVSIAAPLQIENVYAAISATTAFAPIVEFDLASPAHNARHSSDPPSYILTHSFRC